MYADIVAVLLHPCSNMSMAHLMLMQLQVRFLRCHITRNNTRKHFAPSKQSTSGLRGINNGPQSFESNAKNVCGKGNASPRGGATVETTDTFDMRLKFWHVVGRS